MKIFDNNKEKITYIAGFILRQEEGTGLLIKINENSKNTIVVDEKKFSYSGGWENLYYDIDELLFGFEKKHEVELKKAVFFAYSHLIDDTTNVLKDEYKEAVEKVVKENKLEALGYIEYHEALAQYLKHKEQASFTAVVVEVDKPAVTAVMYKAGEKVFSETVAKTEDITADLEEIFSQSHDSTVLPSRIIMYDSSGLENESTKLLTHEWSKGMFIQLPKVEVLHPEELLLAMLHGFKNQYFNIPENADRDSVRDDSDYVDNDDDDIDDEAQDYDENKDAHVSDEEKEHNKIRKSDKENLDKKGAPSGFVIGGDVAENVQDNIQADVSEEEFEITMDKKNSERYSRNEKHMSQNIITAFHQMIGKVTYLFNRQSRMEENKSGVKIPPLRHIIALSILCVIVGSLIFSIFYFFHKAKLTLYYKIDPIEKDITFTSFEAKSNSQNFTETVSMKTTGEKEVGEKAKGSVTINNYEVRKVTLSKGTLLKKDNLVYLLDENTVLDPGKETINEDEIREITPSKTKASITAEEIGEEFNIDDEIKLTIEGIAETNQFAKTSGKITGGTKEVIKTASKEDIRKLDSILEKKFQKLSEVSMNKASKDMKLLKGLSETDITKREYSKEVAEEANDIEEKATARVTYYSYDESTLKKDILEKIADNIPEKYRVKADDIVYSIESADKDEDSGEITIEVEVSAHPVYKLDEKKLKADVKGKKLSSLKVLLKETYKVSGYKADIQSDLPMINQIMPIFTQNIDVNVDSL